MSLDTFFERFTPSDPDFSSSSFLMTKVKAKQLIENRLAQARRLVKSRWTRAYSKSVCAVFKALVDSIPTGGLNFTKVDIRDTQYVASIPGQRIARKADVHIDTVYEALAQLKEEKFIIPLPDKGKYGQERFVINTGRLENVQINAKPQWDRKKYDHKRYLQRKKNEKVQQ